MNKPFAVFTLVIIAIAGTAVPAQAAYVVTATETGGDVVFEGSGSLDLTAWIFSSTDNRIGGIQPDTFFTLGSSGAVSVDTYILASNFSGPLSIGSGSTFIAASSGTGDYTGLEPSFSALFVPNGYTSEDPLLGSTTFAGQTFSSLGLNPGVYEWTWGVDGTADSYTLSINAVPIPAAVWLFGTALIGLVGFSKRRKAV